MLVFPPPQIGEQSASSKFEEEIRKEQEERKIQEVEKKQRRNQFKGKAGFFEAEIAKQN